MRRAKAATWETDAMADWNAAFGSNLISADLCAAGSPLALCVNLLLMYLFKSPRRMCTCTSSGTVHGSFRPACGGRDWAIHAPLYQDMSRPVLLP